MAQKALNQEPPILPRSPWKDQRAWFKLMIIKTKKALDEAEKKSLRANSIRDFQ